MRTISDIIELDKSLASEGQALMLRKNADYTGGDADPLKNFRRHGAFGIIVRLSDKLSRLETYVLRRTYAVKSDSFRQEILDTRNYCTLLLEMCPEADQDPPQ